MYDFRQLTLIIQKMAEEIHSQQLSEPILVGIHSGGVWLAERLQCYLKIPPPLGTLDISFYRDDFNRVGLHPEVHASHLPMTVDNRTIILVDDVLHTGRTIRAALNEIFAYGRPQRVYLAVLIERPGRELPIQADVVGKSLTLADHQHAKLNYVDDQLTLDIIEIGKPVDTAP